ncbi:hypothetical protein LQW54_009310 [Pestalotiopsis sp. IQ-011]
MAQSQASLNILAIVKGSATTSLAIRAMRNKQIVYIRVPRDVFLTGWDLMTSVEPDLSMIPESNNCKVWSLDVVEGEGIGRSVQALGHGIPTRLLGGVQGIDHIPGLSTIMKAEYSEFTSIHTQKMGAGEGRRTDRLQVATHPKLDGKVMIKIAEIPDVLPLDKNEVFCFGTGEAEMTTEIIYHHELSETGLAPKFIGLVTEKGRGVIGYIMEYMEGCQSFEELVKTRKCTPQDIENGLKLIDQMHARGIYHGDLHPGNMLRCPNGSVRIIDFQFSKRLNAEGFVEGKPIYSASNEREDFLDSALDR